MVESNIDKKTIVKSFGWKMAERVFAQGIEFIVQVILARILLPSDFASLAIIVAITNYAAIFVQSGLSTAIIQKENLDELDISTLMVSSLAIALFFYIILYVLAPSISTQYQLPELNAALRVLGLILFLNAINSVQIAVLQRKMQFKSLFIRNIIAVPIAGAVGIGMALLGYGIWALVAHNLISMLVLVLVICLGTDFRFDFHFSWKRAMSLYSFSGKILIASLVSGLYDTTRTMVIGKKYSSDDLAYYDKSYTYSYYVVKVIGYSVSSVMLPVLSRQQNDMEKLKSTSRNSVRLSTFIMFPLLLGVAAVSQSLVAILLTEKWLPCVPFLMLFCILRLPECMITIDKQAYYALGRSGICLFYEIGLCVTNLAFLIATIKLGVLAIAIGAVIVQLLAGASICIISSKVYKYTIMDRIKDLYKPAINSLLMATIVYFVKYLGFEHLITLIIQIILGIVSYFALSVLSHDENLTSVKVLLNTFLINRKRGELQ